MTNMKTWTVWFTDEAKMCCWLIKIPLKLFYDLTMEKHTPICFPVISITCCNDSLTHPFLFLPLLFHLHIVFFFITVCLEKTIYILLIIYLLAKTIALVNYKSSPNNFNKNWTLLHRFLKDSGHGCRTAILLNTPECTCGQTY